MFDKYILQNGRSIELLTAYLRKEGRANPALQATQLNKEFARQYFRDNYTSEQELSEYYKQEAQAFENYVLSFDKETTKEALEKLVF